MSFLLSLFLLLNAERPAPLAFDADLSVRAYERAEYLCAHPFSHSGWTAWFAGVPGGWIGENLARNFADATTTHAALMASPTHRANIVNGRYGRVGIWNQDCPANDYGTESVTVELFAL